MLPQSQRKNPDRGSRFFVWQATKQKIYRRRRRVVFFATFLRVVFFAVFLLAAFLFGAFLATFLRVAFLFGAFLLATFLRVAFLFAGFLLATFLRVVFRRVVFFAAFLFVVFRRFFAGIVLRFWLKIKRLVVPKRLTSTKVVRRNTSLI